MAKHPILNAETRTSIGTGKLNQLRRDGFIPCNVYGAGMDNINIQVNEREFSQLISSSVSEHILVDLKLDGKTKLALLKDIQHNDLKGTITHADFLAVTDNTEISSLVPVVLEGESVGVSLGGLLEQTVHELHVKCQVKNLPETITVDVSALQIGDALRISDLKLPKGVIATTAAETPVVVIEEPKVKADAGEAVEA